MKKKAGRIAFFILTAGQGIFWAILGAQRTALPGGPQDPIAWLLLADAALFVLLPFFYLRARWITVLAAVFLAGNLILTLTDQTGLSDWIILGMNAAGLVLLFVNRALKNR